MKKFRTSPLPLFAVACLSFTPLAFAEGEVTGSVEAGDAAPVETTPSDAAATDATSAESKAAAEEGGIDEIIVTAQRRAQNLQDVPISISAVTAESLEAMGVDATDDLATIAPGLNLTRQWGSATPYIRGVGTPLVLGGNESAVALYVDGIYMPQLASLTFSFNNIARVEVLKGPQGTLFGRNATGGLIQIVTRDPSQTPSLVINTSYDNYQTTESTLYGTTGLSDSIAGDLSVYYADQGEGYGENQFNGKDVYARKELGLRTSLYYREAKTQAKLSIDHVKTDGSLGIARQADRGARTINGQGPQDDYWDVNLNYDPRNELEGTGAGLKISHDFENVQFISLSSYRDSDNIFNADQDGTPLRVIDAIISDDTKTLSQELQLQSTGDGPLSWITGLYYFDFDVNYQVQTRGSVGPLVGPLPSPPFPAGAAIGGTRIVTSTQDTKSYAAYAQGTYAFSEVTNLTLGIRYTKDERDFKGSTALPNATVNGMPLPGGITIPQTAPDSESDSEPTWRIALDRKFSPDTLGYVSYNRGFKSGVYNMINPNDQPVSSEKVNAYELGLKIELLHRRLRINSSAFYYDYNDLQAQTINQGSVVLFNAPKAEIKGGEIELQALPTERLEINANIALLDSEYTDFPNADITTPNPAPAGGNSSVKGSVKGNEVARAPDFTASLGGRFGIPVSGGEVGFSGSITYNGGFYWEPDNRSKQDAFTLFNAQIDWRRADQKYRLYIFGKNLSSEEYSQYLSGGSFGDIVSAAPPRTFGFGGEMRFE